MAPQETSGETKAHALRHPTRYDVPLLATTPTTRYAVPLLATRYHLLGVVVQSQRARSIELPKLYRMPVSSEALKAEPELRL
jgi:hypothetical protein